MRLYFRKQRQGKRRVMSLLFKNITLLSGVEIACAKTINDGAQTYPEDYFYEICLQT